jgi:hypothetical protein
VFENVIMKVFNCDLELLPGMHIEFPARTQYSVLPIAQGSWGLGRHAQTLSLMLFLFLESTSFSY